MTSSVSGIGAGSIGGSIGGVGVGGVGVGGVGVGGGGRCRGLRGLELKELIPDRAPRPASGVAFGGERRRHALRAAASAAAVLLLETRAARRQRRDRSSRRGRCRVHLREHRTRGERHLLEALCRGLDLQRQVAALVAIVLKEQRINKERKLQLPGLAACANCLV